MTRTPIEVTGTLHWATARRLGGVKSHVTPITTVDLSVDGARVLIEKQYALPRGASCRLAFGEQSSPARVVGATEYDADTALVRLHLEHPSREFMKVLERWLAIDAGGRKFVGENWTADV